MNNLFNFGLWPLNVVVNPQCSLHNDVLKFFSPTLSHPIAAMENKTLMWKGQTTNVQTLDTRDFPSRLGRTPSSSLQRRGKCANLLTARSLSVPFPSEPRIPLTLYVTIARTAGAAPWLPLGDFPSAVPLTQCLFYHHWMFLCWGLRSRASLESTFLNVSCTELLMYISVRRGLIDIHIYSV